MFPLEDVDCEALVAASIASIPSDQPQTPTAAGDGFCANNFDFFAGAADAVLLAVDSCSEPLKVNAPKIAGLGVGKGGSAFHCFVREVVSAPGTVPVVAASEATEVVWPRFSTRLERGHPAFRDPIVGAVFLVRFDDRFPDELRVFAAKAIGAT